MSDNELHFNEKNSVHYKAIRGDRNNEFCNVFRVEYFSLTFLYMMIITPSAPTAYHCCPLRVLTLRRAEQLALRLRLGHCHHHRRVVGSNGGHWRGMTSKVQLFGIFVIFPFYYW